MDIYHFVTTIILIVVHFTVTLPSFIVEGTYNTYRRCAYSEMRPTIQHTTNLIVCVHGRGGHSSNFNPLIDNLRNRGLSHDVVAFNLGDTRGTSVQTDAQVLHDKLTQFIQANQSYDITLMGLSKGGLVAIYYANNFSFPNVKVTRIITISSPLQGTRAANIFPQDSVTYKELGYHNDFVIELANNLPNVPLYHVVPLWDHVIIPTSAAKYETTPDSQIYYYQGYLNHIAIPYSPEVADKIISWLQS